MSDTEQVQIWTRLLPFFTLSVWVGCFAYGVGYPFETQGEPLLPSNPLPSIVLTLLIVGLMTATLVIPALTYPGGIPRTTIASTIFLFLTGIVMPWLIGHADWHMGHRVLVGFAVGMAHSLAYKIVLADKPAADIA